VSSLGVPPALTVSTANMKSNGEIVPRNSCQAGVVAVNASFKFDIRVPTVFPHLLALQGIDIVGIKRGVQLDVSHSFFNEPLDFIADDFDEILQKISRGGVKAVRDTSLIAGQKKIRWSRDRDFEWAVRLFR